MQEGTQETSHMTLFFQEDRHNRIRDGQMPLEVRTEDTSSSSCSLSPNCNAFLSSLVAVSFSMQNTALNLNALYEAGKDWGAIESGHEFSSAVTWLILASGVPLGLVNTRSYYRLMQDFLGKSGGFGLAQRWSSLDGWERAKFVNGTYVSLVKTIVGGLSLYNLSQGLSQSGSLALGLTIASYPFNFIANATVFLRKRPVTPYFAVSAELQVAYLERRNILGDKQNIRHYITRSSRLHSVRREEAKNCPNVTAVVFAVGYALFNANLYLDSTYSFGRAHGAVAANTPTYRSLYFWLMTSLVATPVAKGNYDGYQPLMKELFTHLSDEGAGDCGAMMQRMFGNTKSERFWNTSGLSAAGVKTVAAAIALMKIGIELFGAESEAAQWVVRSLGIVGGTLVGVANAGVYLQPKVDYTLTLLGPDSSSLVRDIEMSDTTPLKREW